MYDVVIVGGGIMGATIGEAFKRFQSRDVRIVDDGRPLAGTPPSGGSVTPSKLTGLGDELVNPVLDTLDEIWGLRKENFVVKPSMGLLKYDVYQTDMGAILGVDKVNGTVEKVSPLQKSKGWAVTVRMGADAVGDLLAKTVVVCAGAFCGELFPEVFGNELTAKVGVSFRWHGRLKQAFAQQWRPYLKIFAHPIHLGDGKWETWGCDGTAIVQKNWDDSKIVDCRERVLQPAEIIKRAGIGAYFGEEVEEPPESDEDEEEEPQPAKPAPKPSSRASVTRTVSKPATDGRTPTRPSASGQIQDRLEKRSDTARKLLR